MIPLQPLRVPTLWRIKLNHLYEIDPADAAKTWSPGEYDPDSVWNYCFDNSYLYIAICYDIRIFVEWTPMADINGYYEITVIQLDSSKHNKNDIETIELLEAPEAMIVFHATTKSRKTMVAMLERLMSSVFDDRGSFPWCYDDIYQAFSLPIEKNRLLYEDFI